MVYLQNPKPIVDYILRITKTLETTNEVRESKIKVSTQAKNSRFEIVMPKFAAVGLRLIIA